MSEDFTSIDKLGEFGLIQALTENIPLQKASTILGVGDDAAAFDHLLELSLCSSDLLVEGVHFDLTYVPPQHLGYKAAVVNFSDIAAMNGQPSQLLINLGISNRFGLEYLQELYRGVKLACEVYAVDLVGGDTTSSFSGLLISGTAIGSVPSERLVKRSGAKPNDLVVVSGDLGGAYLGLQILQREKSVFEADPDMQPQLAGNEYVLQRQLRPEARTDVVELLESLDVLPTSMIDLSDGLSSDLLHLCEASKTGVHLYEEKLPIDDQVFELAETFSLNASTVALNGGEDYELLFTIDLKDHDKIKGNPHLTVIGHMTDLEEGRHLITPDGNRIALQAQGWNSLHKQQK